MRAARAILLPVVALGLLATPAVAGIAVRLAPETATLFVHEPFALRLEVESDVPPETPDLPAVPGLTVVTIRRLPPEPARQEHAFRIALIAERDGVLTLPPFPVRAGGESAMAPPLRMRLRAPRRATEMELKVDVEPTELRVGQPATITVTWSSAVPFARCKQLLIEMPLVADERCRLFPLDPPGPEGKRTGLPVNNQRLVAGGGISPDGRRWLAFRYKLVPREPCVLRAHHARLSCALMDAGAPTDGSPGHFYNHFFMAPGRDEPHERIYLAAPVAEIIARALPEEGRSARFAGIVGPCELRASVAPSRLVVGQPALLTVRLDGMAFARHIVGLPAAAFDGLRPEFRLSAEPIRETVTDSARSFTHVLRPLRAGIARIPAIVIQTWDPGTGEYKTLRSAPLPITVEPDPENGARAVAPRLDSKPPIPLNGVRHNRAGPQMTIPLRDLLEFLGRHWWVIVPIPPLLWLALRPLARRWERCRRDPVYARATGAWRHFRQTARRDEEKAWRHYFADRLGLCVEALTADTAAEALRARQVDPGLIEETRRCFEERDAAEYGKRPPPSSRSIHDLVRRLHRATLPLLLACGMTMAPDPAWPQAVAPKAMESAPAGISDASLRRPAESVVGRLRQAAAEETPDELFARAIELRGERPDEAQALFAEAALRFESAGRLLNAGNSWFFAGESGRALVNYRAAERRWPFDRQLRESIAFLRANRADAFPAPATPPGRAASFWLQFCTWSATLRAGLFVVAYLLAWMLFLGAQLAGWRIRRAIWAVLGVAALLPLVSLVQSGLRPREGVVVEDAVARLGPGYAYDPAFQQPLHKATEFSWMETRQGWVRARLPDASEGWLRESDCMKIE